MEDLSQLTGQDIKLSINGKEYKFSPITVEDVAVFSQRLKDESIKAYNRTKGGAAEFVKCPVCEGSGLVGEKENRCMSCQGKGYIVNEILVQLLRLPIPFSDIMDAMNTLDGAIFLLWRSLKKNHPDIKLSEVERLFTISKTYQVFDIMNALATATMDESNKGEKEKNGLKAKEK